MSPFLIATLATTIASGLALYFIGLAQTGPGWEVPSHVATMLGWGGPVTMLVSLIGFSLTSMSLSAKGISSMARTVLFIWTVVAVAMSTLVVLGKPEQWPVKFPVISHLVSSVLVPGEVVILVLAVLVVKISKRP